MKQILCAMLIVLTSVSLSFAASPAQLDVPVPGPGEFLPESTPVHPHLYDLREALDFDSLDVAFTGNWPFGSSYSLSTYAAEDIVFLGAGAGVLITDVSDPENPVVLSEVRARSLVDGSYYDPATQILYLAAYFSGVEMWDVSDLTNPICLGRCPTEPYPRAGVYVRDDYAFAATVAYGLRVLDISDHNDAGEVAACAIDDMVWNAAFTQDYAFLTGNTGGLRVIDLSDPLNPYIAATNSQAKGAIFLADDYAYFAHSSFGLRIFDMSDPTDMTLVGEVDLEGSPSKIVVRDDLAYIANAWGEPHGGLDIIDVSNPMAPTVVGHLNGYAVHIGVIRDHVYLSGSADGLVVVDAQSPDNPQAVATMPLPGFLDEVTIQDGYAYTGSNGFRVFDVSDPSYPVQVGYHETAGSLVGLAGDYAPYILKTMTGSNYVHIMDISDPTAPSPIGSYFTPAMTYDLDVAGNYAFVACWWDGLRIIDFSNPASPQMVAHVLGWENDQSIPGEEYCFAQAVAVQGDYAYVIDYMPFEDQDTKGLYIIDISDPANATVINRFADVSSRCWDIAVQGDVAYLADSNGGLELINIADPLNPSFYGYAALEDAAQGVDVLGDHAFVANYIYGGVQVMDVSIPVYPHQVGYYKRTGCFALGVTADENYLYVADGIAGFQVYDNLLYEPTALDDETLSRHRFYLSPNYPNPFRNTTTVRLEIERPTPVILTIFNSAGQLVRRIERRPSAKTGQIEITWDGRNQSGVPAADGIYLYRLAAGDNQQQGRMVLVR